LSKTEHDALNDVPNAPSQLPKNAQVVVLTISDGCSQGLQQDRSGPAVAALLESANSRAEAGEIDRDFPRSGGDDVGGQRATGPPNKDGGRGVAGGEHLGGGVLRPVAGAGVDLAGGAGRGAADQSQGGADAEGILRRGQKKGEARSGDYGRALRRTPDAKGSGPSGCVRAGAVRRAIDPLDRSHFRLTVAALERWHRIALRASLR